jgi:putative heme degradation protein
METCFRCCETRRKCKCENPIFDKDEYIDALETSLAKDGETITHLYGSLNWLQGERDHHIEKLQQIKELIDK